MDKEVAKCVMIMESGTEIGCVYFIKWKDMKDVIAHIVLRK